MNIPQMKVGPQQIVFMRPNPSYFKYKITVRRPVSTSDDATNSPNLAQVETEYHTRCHFERKSALNIDNQQVISSEFVAEALVRLVSGMNDVMQGWTCILHEPQGKTQWKVFGVQWPFGFRSSAVVLRLRRTTDAIREE